MKRVLTILIAVVAIVLCAFVAIDHFHNRGTEAQVEQVEAVVAEPVETIDLTVSESSDYTINLDSGTVHIDFFRDSVVVTTSNVPDFEIVSEGPIECDFEEFDSLYMYTIPASCLQGDSLKRFSVFADGKVTNFEVVVPLIQ